MITCYRRTHQGRWVVTFCHIADQIYVLTQSTHIAAQYAVPTWFGLRAGHEFEEIHR